MVYTAWGKDGLASLVKGGEGPPRGANGALLLPEEHPDLIWVIESETWEGAMIRYHELQGWEPYVPMDAGDLPTTSAGR